MSERRVTVVGGGASGLMAAIHAARCGAKTTLLEKNRQTGKKLLATGNGRCNFTNRDQRPEMYHGQHTDLALRSLGAFSMEETVDFFRSIGICPKEREGWLYPASFQAADVAEALRLEALRAGVKIACNGKVTAVEKCGDVFRTHTDGWVYESEALILACGSQAAPATGSDGDGYRFARSFGHTVLEPLPALTALTMAETDCKRLTGVRAEAQVKLLIDGTPAAAETGEVQFTAYGLSGIPVFQVSRYASEAVRDGHICRIFLDLSAGQEKDVLLEKLKKRVEMIGERAGSAFLLGMFPQKLCGVLLERSGIPIDRRAADWTDAELIRLSEQIRDMRFTVTGSRGFDQAQVCAGGVPLSELKIPSMESRIVSGLYLAGELLDVDGACGGYNLQWAWSSGALAGRNAASGEKEE